MVALAINVAKIHIRVNGIRKRKRKIEKRNLIELRMLLFCFSFY